MAPENLEWLPQGELQSDALLDLQTKDNSLSVFRVEDAKDTERVVVALAANRCNPAHLDYAIFDDTDLASIGIVMKLQEGDTPDVWVNKLHYNLTNLTVNRLVQIAETVAVGDHSRALKKDLAAKVKHGINTGTLDKSKIKPTLLGKLKI